MRCGIIILAAGASSRMGRPKQLLRVFGKSLLGHTVDVALASAARPVVVVLGAKHDIIAEEINDKSIHIVVNDDWQEGIASSIRSGLSAITNLAPAVSAVVLAVCDQPFLSAKVIDALVNQHALTGKSIVAASYGETLGTPVLFDSTMFAGLSSLTGDTGAKAMIKRHFDKVSTVNFPEGSLDIDTDDDFASLGKFV